MLPNSLARKIPHLYVRVAPAALYFFFIMLGIILGRGARDSLFLAHPRLGIPALPWIYIGNALFGAVAAAVYAAIVTRLSPKKFSLISLGLLAACVLGARLLAGFGSAPAVIGCYLMAQAVWVLGLMQVWTVVSNLFDPREAKQAYPLVGAGSLAGMIAAGFIAKPIVAVCGTLGSFWVWLGLQLAAAAILFTGIVPKLSLEKPVSDKEKHAGSGLKQNFQMVWNMPLLHFLLLLTMVLWIVFTVLDYQFNVVARERYTVINAQGVAAINKDGLTAFLGIFRGVCGFGALLFQFLVTPLLVKRLGVGRGVIVHPLANMFTTAGMAAAFGFWTTTIAKGIDHILLYTIQDSSYSLLFNAVPARIRGKARSFVEGTIRPVATGLGGVVLLCGATMLSRAQLSGILFVFSFIWLLVALRIRLSYVQGLVSELGSGKQVGAETLDDLVGPENIVALKETLKNGDPGKVIAAIDMIALLRADELRPDLYSALNSPSPEIRGAALSALAAVGGSEDYNRVLVLTRDPDSRVRGNAVEACGALGDEFGAEQIIPLLHDPDEQVRVSTIVALIRIGGLDGILSAAETLGKMIESTQVTERALVAKILGEVKVRHFVPSLIKLLKDPNPLVRHRAVRSLGKIGAERSAQTLVECLADPHLQRTALFGLTRMGKKAIPFLKNALGSGTPELRRLAAEGLSKIGKKDVNEILVNYINDPDPEVRSAVLEGLTSHDKKVIQSEARKDTVIKVIQEELKNTYLVRYGRQGIKTQFSNADNESVSLLREVMKETEAAASRRALLAFGLITRPEAIKDLAVRAASPVSRIRSLALEAIENLGIPELARPLVAILDPDSREWENKLDELVPVHERRFEYFLEQWVTHPSPLVRAALGLALATERGAAAEQLRTRLKNDPHSLVAESARWESSPKTSGGTDMLTTIEKVLFLRGAPLFGTINREDLPHIAAIAEIVTYPAGEIIFETGAAGDALYLIVEGTVAVIDKDGATMTELQPPEVFGEMAILDDSPRSATIRTAEPVTLLRISREEFRELIMERPEIAFSIFKLLIGRLRSVMTQRRAADVLTV